MSDTVRIRYCTIQSHSRKNYGRELIGRPCGRPTRRHNDCWKVKELGGDCSIERSGTYWFLRTGYLSSNSHVEGRVISFKHSLYLHLILRSRGLFLSQIRGDCSGLGSCRRHRRARVGRPVSRLSGGLGGRLSVRVCPGCAIAAATLPVRRTAPAAAPSPAP